MPASGHDPLERLTDLLGRLPGVGEKTALRLALHVVTADPAYVEALADALVTARAELRLCERCRDLCGGPLCPRCSDARRDAGLLCVVARPQDRIAMERAGVFRGVYHVLHGVLDPLAGVGPNELEIDSLLRRLDPADGHAGNGGAPVREVIVATSANVEGDATALYVSRLLAPLGIPVSRIASGLAVGGEVEYADASTLHRALEDRRPLASG